MNHPTRKIPTPSWRPVRRGNAPFTRALAAALCLWVAAAGTPSKARTTDPAVERTALELVESWRRAWESGDIDRYIDHYAPGFRSRGMGREEWRRYKATVFERSGDISVQVWNVAVAETDRGVEVAFDQQYRSAVLEDFGRKTLVLRPTDRGMKIFREGWEAYPPGSLPEPPEEPAVEFPPLMAETLEEDRNPSVEPTPDEAPGIDRAAATLPEVEVGPDEPALPSFQPQVNRDPAEVWAREPGAGEGMARRTPSSRVPTRPVILEEIVAKVNDAIITKSELETRAREQPERQDLMDNYAGPELQEKLTALRGAVLEELINELLLLQRAEDLGVDIESFVDRYLDDVKAESQIETDAELEQLLEQEGMSLAKYKERIRRRKIPQRLVYEEVTARVDVTDQEVRDYYESNRERYRKPEEVVLREIVLLHDNHGGAAARRAIEDIHERLLRGADFAEMARRVSETPSGREGGYLGSFRRDEMSQALGEPAFSLEEGSISEPIETSHGWHILKVDERLETRVVPLAEVEGEIRERLTNQLWNEKMEEYLEDLYRTNTIVVNQDYQARAAPPSRESLEARR